MANVFMDPRPNRYTQIAGVLQNALDQYQQQQNQDQQQSSQNEQQKRLRAGLFLQQVYQLPPDQRDAAMRQAPPDVQSYLINMDSLPRHQPTDAEAAQGNYDKYRRSASEDFASPLTGDPNKIALFDDKLASAKPFMEQQGQRYNYANQSALPPEVNTAQRIGDKIQPTGQEAFTNQNVTLPKTNAEISHLGSQTREQNAAAVNQTAQAGEHNANAKATAAGDVPQNLQVSVGDRDVRTTTAGKKYADISGYTGKTKNDLKAYYEGRGIAALDRNEVTAMHDIETARMNTQSIITSIESKLPKDATGRVTGGAISNRLSQVFQTDADLAAFNAYRAAAIRNLRAMAGSTGLRMNETEIKLAVENDIPKITDTVGTAQAKMKNINTMLDNAEAPILSRGGSSAQTTDVNSGGLYGTYVLGQGLVKH